MRVVLSGAWPLAITTSRLITYCLAALSAIPSTVGSDLIQSHHEYSAELAARLVGEERIHMDTNSGPVLLPRLEVRQVGDEGTSSKSSSRSSRATQSATTTVPQVTATGTATNQTSSGSNSTSTGTATTSTVPVYTPKTLPLPFDTSIGTNFTSSNCPLFFQSFLSNSTFKSCAPVSLLLQNSLSFFQAVRSPPVLVKTLDTSCAASLALCSPLMSSIASNLISSSNCAEDFKRQNPIVTQAYTGLMAYESMFKASCLKKSNTQTYCMADAFTNANNNTDPASDSYPYYLAIGIDLPNTSTPTCTTCLKNTMEIFAGYARMKGQPLADTYLDAARHLNAGCGSTFTDQNVQVATEAGPNAAPRLAGLSGSWMASVVAASLALALSMTI